MSETTARFLTKSIHCHHSSARLIPFVTPKGVQKFLDSVCTVIEKTEAKWLQSFTIYRKLNVCRTSRKLCHS